MSNLALIQPRPLNFDTTQMTDWLDGLPVIGAPGLGGTVSGAANVGNGSIAAVGIAAGMVYGAHTVAITAVAGGLTYLGVTDPTGLVIGQGVVGAPLYAAGLSLTLAQGATPFGVGDSFAISVIPVAVDITGLRFDLDARASISDLSIALQATSAGSLPTIVTGGVSGTVAMQVHQATMAQLPPKPDGYPYAIVATDPMTGLKVPAFYGLIHHTAVPAQIGQGA